MYFAFFYLLFFALDILVVMEFAALGMIPMNYLVAGVGFFCCYQGGKCFSQFSNYRRSSFIYCLFFFYILIISLSNFFWGNFRIVRYIFKLSVFFEIVPAWVLFALSGILSLSIAVFLPMSSSLSRWMLFSSLAGAVRFGITFIFSGSIFLHRWDGVLDLVMLFGWLMIIITYLRMEYGLGIKPS